MLLSCSHVGNEKRAVDDRLPDPVIKAGIARLDGKITNFHLKQGDEIPTLTLHVPHPVTGDVAILKAHLNEDGTFHYEVPVESNITIGSIGSDIFKSSISVSLAANEESKLEIIYDETGKFKATVVNKPELTSDDMITLGDMMGKMLDHQSPERIPRYNMLIEDFVPYELKSLERKLNIAKNDSILSGRAKNYITNEFKLIYLSVRFFRYIEIMKNDFMRYNKEKRRDDFNPHEPGKSYYAFLKYFNLNDPQYLYNGTYSEVLQAILSNQTLNIPAIKDTPVKDWLEEVKTNMADLVGSDTGLFYELLAANAYVRQFNNGSKPLSDKQIENIRSYFRNVEITKILLEKNVEVTKLDEEKKHSDAIINKTPVVPKEALMKAIISRYKGKAVLVDFWATWCMPCMNAMNETKIVKTEMHDKKIAFVYITNASSPRELWEEKIKLIGGEHYYLTQEEWEYLLDSFGFSGIPTYLFYDKKGELKNKVTAYPGTEKMQKMIGELLL